MLAVTRAARTLVHGFVKLTINVTAYGNGKWNLIAACGLLCLCVAVLVDVYNRLAVMNVFVTRNPGPFGKRVPLEILCNGKRRASVGENEKGSVRLQASDLPATMEVRMQQSVGSPKIIITELSSELHLVCGAEIWNALDFLGLAFLPGLRSRVFYFRAPAPTN